MNTIHHIKIITQDSLNFNSFSQKVTKFSQSKSRIDTHSVNSAFSFRVQIRKWCTDLKMKNIVCGSYHKMSVTAITARFATLVWTAATIRFITQTPRMMKNNGNALTIGFVRAFLVFSENKLRQIRVKRRFWRHQIRKSLVFQGFSGFCNYSHSLPKS